MFDPNEKPGNEALRFADLAHEDLRDGDHAKALLTMRHAGVLAMLQIALELRRIGDRLERPE